MTVLESLAARIAFSLTPVSPTPGGSIRPFCEPETVTSTPHSSMRKSAEARPETLSTRNRAGCRAASIAFLISAMFETTPVEVSLWTTQTALISCFLSSRRRASMTAGSAALRQSDSMNSGVEAQLLRHGLPQRREVPGLEHQDLVAGGEHIDESRFPRARAGGREQEDMALGLEDGLDARQHAQAQLLEFRAAVIEHRLVHCPQDAVGHRRRAGNLQEMTSGNARLIGRHKSSGQALDWAFFFHTSRPVAQDCRQDCQRPVLLLRTHLPRRGDGSNHPGGRS